MPFFGDAPLFKKFWLFCWLALCKVEKTCCSPIKIAILWWGCFVGCLCCAVFQFVLVLNPPFGQGQKVGERGIAQSCKWVVHTH